MNSFDAAHAHFPLWIELSGLPEKLNGALRGGYAWTVFRKIVELDLAANPHQPGMVELPLADLGQRCGLDGARALRAVKAMRKLGLVRAFLPDTAEEPALFQIITPLATPVTADAVRGLHMDLFLESPWPPRYAVEAGTGDVTPAGRLAKVQRVVDLYLNTFSMKLNSLILDELQLIADRYDMALTEKVFARAKKAGATSLGWVLSEIHREIKAKARRAETS